MLEQVAAALERQDYRTAAELLKQLVKESPNNPWVQFYIGRLHEVSGKLEAAEKVYRQLLRNTTHTQIVIQARQGLQRLEATVKKQRQQLLAQATAAPNQTQLGVLILEPVKSDIRNSVAQRFGQIMQIDPYTAKLQLPSRGWRLHRTGPIGELHFLGQQLRDSGIPCFWTTLTELQEIQVFQVHYFQSASPQAVVVCQSAQGQLGSISFNWSDVSQRIIGRLPIFEEVVDLDPRGKLQRKTQTQDYAQFCDLHLPKRRCILRLHDNSYQFHQDTVIFQERELNTHPSQTTTRINWNSLLNFLDKQLPQAKVWSDFPPFAQMALDQTELLSRLQSHIHLFRRAETGWDSAFHLYSGLVFIRNS